MLPLEEAGSLHYPQFKFKDSPAERLFLQGNLKQDTVLSVCYRVNFKIHQ